MARNLQDTVDYGILKQRALYSPAEIEAAQIRLISKYTSTFTACIQNVGEQFPELDLSRVDDGVFFNRLVWMQFLNIVDAGEALP